MRYHLPLSYRASKEARLCHFDGSQGRGPDQPEPKTNNPVNASKQTRETPSTKETAPIAESTQRAATERAVGAQRVLDSATARAPKNADGTVTRKVAALNIGPVTLALQIEVPDVTGIPVEVSRTEHPGGGSATEKKAADAANAAPSQKPENPKKEKEKVAIEKAQTAVREAGGDTGDRFNNACDTLKKSLAGNDMGEFLKALKEFFDSLKAIFKPEAEKKNDRGVPSSNKPVEVGTEGDGKTKTSVDAPESGERQSERRDRLRKEVSDAGSIDAFKKNRFADRDKKMTEYNTKIDAGQAKVQSIDEGSDSFKQQIADLKQHLSDPRDRPDNKETMKKQVRDLTIKLEANEKLMENERKDIEEMTDKRDKVHADTESDIREVDSMLKEAQDKAKDVTKRIDSIANGPDRLKNPEASAILKGITVTVSEKTLSPHIHLSEEVKRTIVALGQKMNVSVQWILDLADDSRPAADTGSPEQPSAAVNSGSDIPPEQMRVARGLGRVAQKLAEKGKLTPVVLRNMEREGRTSDLANQIVQALENGAFPIYIDKKSRALKAQESFALFDKLNPDTVINNGNFANLLKVNPEVAMRTLGEYGDKPHLLNSDTRLFLLDLVNVYEQGVRAYSEEKRG